MHFCQDCNKILIIKTDTQSVIKYCSGCEKEFPGDDDDTLISSSFVSTGGYNTDLILKLAPFDRVNQVIKHKCPTENCKRKYMYKVFINNQVWYVCDNCDIKLSGKDISISI